MPVLILFLLVVCAIHNADGACTFPSDLRGTWISSDRGSLTFNSSHVADYTVYNQGTLTFACDSLVGSYYILKSEEFTLFSSPAIAMMCITFTSLKESLYKYQIHTSMLQDADYQRIRFAATGTSVGSSLACTDLGSSDYYLLMADGQISAVKEQCPDIFLGTFGFSSNDSDCTNNTGSLDVCTDLNTMTFNYSACNTVQAYSSGGSVSCLYSSTTGDVTTLNVYNMDSTTDESTTFRFTCYVIEQTSGSSNVYATQYPKDCHVNQTSTYVPAPGANLTMLASVTCVPTTTESTAVSQASLIAGIAAGLFVLLLLVLLIICFYCYKKKSKIQPTGKAPIDTETSDLHPDTACYETPESTTEPVETARDDFGILQDSNLNVNFVKKQNGQTTDAIISLKGNKDGNLQQLRLRDRQSSTRFTVSNLKQNYVTKKTKAEPKLNPSTNPAVPKKRLPWPALFLPPDNDKRKNREREKRKKLSTELSKCTPVFQETAGIVEENMKVTANEKINPPGILQIITSKDTEVIHDAQKKDYLKENDNQSTSSKISTQEKTTDMKCEIVSHETVTGFEEENVEETEPTNSADISQGDINSGAEKVKDELSKMELRKIKDVSSEPHDNTHKESRAADYENAILHNICKEIENKMITDEQEDKHLGYKSTEQEQSVAFKTSIKEDCEQAVRKAAFETKDEGLYENNKITNSDLTRNESVADSGVYSNSSSAEPNAGNETAPYGNIESAEPNTATETIPTGHIEETSSKIKTKNINVATIERTVESAEIKMMAIHDKTTKCKDSFINLIEKSSVIEITKTSNDNNGTQILIDKITTLCVQLDNEQKDPILDEINQKRNVYVDMLNSAMTTDGSDSKFLRKEPDPLRPDKRGDDVVTARHVTLTHKDELTTAETEFSMYQERLIDKEINLEREKTHYSIERNILPSIGNKDNFKKSKESEITNQLKEKRPHYRNRSTENGNSLKKIEHQPTGKHIKNITEPVTSTTSDENVISKLSCSNKIVNDVFPKLVRIPKTDNKETKQKQVLLPYTGQTLTNHKRKSGSKKKEKKFSFLPNITNASMFANEYENTDGQTMSREKDQSKVVTNLGKDSEENEKEKNVKLETSSITPSNEKTLAYETKEEAPPPKLLNSVNKTKPTKLKRVHRRPNELLLPNLMGEQRHSAPEFRLPVLLSDSSVAPRRPASFKDNTHTLTVPLQVNRALVQGSAQAASVGKESKSKSRNNKDKLGNVAGKQTKKAKNMSTVSGEPKRKRKKKQNVDAVENDEEVDTTKYFNDNDRAGKVRPGDNNDLQGLILRIRENTMTDYSFQNNYSDKGPDK